MYIYDDMAMGQDNALMLEQCLNESKGWGKKGHEKWVLGTMKEG